MDLELCITIMHYHLNAMHSPHTYTRTREKSNFLFDFKFMKTWFSSIKCRILCNFSTRMPFWSARIRQNWAIFHQFSGFWGKCWFHLKIKLNWVFISKQGYRPWNGQLLPIFWIWARIGFDFISISFCCNLISFQSLFSCVSAIFSWICHENELFFSKMA